MSIELPSRKDLLSAPKAGKKTYKSYNLADEESGFWKLNAWGRPGTGKTRILAAMLEAGHKVYVCDFDLGGNGLNTVRQALTAAGKAELLRNLEGFDFPDYDTFEEFLGNPNLWQTSQGLGVFEWAPTVLVLEGGSNFQTNMVDEEALSYSAMSNKTTEQRGAGLQAETQDWSVIKRISVRAFDKFLRIHNPSGQKINKYITCHEREADPTKLGDLPAPEIAGGLRKNWAGAFDVCLRTIARTKGGKTEFVYECDPGKSLTKQREYSLPAEMPADPAKLLALLEGRKVA